MGSSQYKLLIGLALVLFATAIILFLFQLEVWSLLVGFMAILLFYVANYNGFLVRNKISYTHKGMTLKLLGKRSFGIAFHNIISADLNEQELQIKLINKEMVTLSRKRYQQQSLIQLQQIIQEKNTSNE